VSKRIPELHINDSLSTDPFVSFSYTEVQAARIIQQVLSAVNYMHQRKVIHRDIKFENIMFENKEPNAQVKLIDFGLATGYYKRVQTARVGTLYTMSPQVIEGMYTSKADLWSVGVVAYMLISGVKPFWGPTRKVITRSILKGKYDFDADIWNDRSPQGKAFVSALLQVDPDERLNAKQALRHAWLRRETRLSDLKSMLERMEIAKTRLVLYAESGEFKKIVMQVIAKKSRTEDILELRKIFNEFDKNQDGTITFGEFKEALSRSNLSDEELRDIFHKLVGLR
jgi:serine/threonine protein kinase